MTRKDYQLIADWFKEYAQGIDCCPDHDAQNMAETLASTLVPTNPNFDRTKFVQACLAK